MIEDKKRNLSKQNTDFICVIFQWFILTFACVCVQMSPPFVLISLPSMLQRKTCANGLMNCDDRDDNDDEQVIRMK